jgi:hypothetical protein
MEIKNEAIAHLLTKSLKHLFTAWIMSKYNNFTYLFDNHKNFLENKLKKNTKEWSPFLTGRPKISNV